MSGPINIRDLIPSSDPLWQRNHPATSRQAAVDARYRAGTDKVRIYDLLVEAGAVGLTGDMVALLLQYRYGRQISANQACTRIGELHDDGFVRRNGEERDTSKGSKAMVWTVRSWLQPCCEVPPQNRCVLAPPWWFSS